MWTTASSNAGDCACSRRVRSLRMPSLSEAESRAALQLARNAVVEAVSHRKLPDQITRDGVFAERRGVFVTLHVSGRLKGSLYVFLLEEMVDAALILCAKCSVCV